MQSSSNIRSRICKILTSVDAMSLQVDVSQISALTSLNDDLALDSIQKLEFGIALEQEFGLNLDARLFDAELDKFGALEQYVLRNAKPAIAE